MSFNVTYGSLLSNNIKHLYTTRQKTKLNLTPRNKLYNPQFLELEIQASERHRRRRARKKPNMEFVAEFDIDIPRAPAFRSADSKYVDDMVARLSRRPKFKAEPRECPAYRRGFYEYELEMEELESPRDPTSRRGMKRIVSRLGKRSECRRRHPSPDLREDDYLPNFTF